jgi:hypothetical protein
MHFRGYSGFTARELEIADNSIIQLQAFLNSIAPTYGLSTVRPDGVFTGATEVLLIHILQAEGQPSAIEPGIGVAIHNATGIGMGYAEKWEWAIMVAMSRAGRAVVPTESLTGGSLRVLTPRGDEEAAEKNGWVVPVIALSAGVLVIIGVAVVATRGK